MSTTAASTETGAPTPSGAGQESRRSAGRRALALIETWGVLITFALVFLVFSLLSPDLFPTWSNIVTIVDQTSIIILIAVGLTFVLASGEFDLSFPYLFGLVSGVTVAAMSVRGISVPLAVVLGLGTGLAAGFVNGAVVSTKRASSFIITLALGSVYTGLMVWIAGASPIAEGVPQKFIDLNFHIGTDISAVMVLAAVVSIAAAIVLRSTLFGRYVQATGSNPDAAAVAGINVTFVRIGAFMALGLCVAIAAIQQAAISGAHYPDAGTSLFLPPFVAAFIGTSVLARGRFNVLGTVIGALFISTLQTGLLVQDAAVWVIDVLEGLVLLAAVLMSVQQRGRGR